MISRSRTVKPAPESGDKLTRFGSVQLAMPRPEVLDILVQCRRDSRSALRLMRAGIGLTFPAMRSEDSSVAMIAGRYLPRSRVHHSVAIIAW